MHYSDMIGSRIRSLREAKGYTQEYMAGMLEISQSTFANIEAGKTKLTFDRLIKIADILQLHVKDIVNDVDQETASDQVRHVNNSPDQVVSSVTGYEMLIHEMKDEIDFLRTTLQQFLHTSTSFRRD